MISRMSYNSDCCKENNLSMIVNIHVYFYGTFMLTLIYIYMQRLVRSLTDCSAF